MGEISKFSNFKKFLEKGPIILLIISVLNEFDFNYLNLKYFSFNFPFILIFFFTLKEFKHFDYLLVFLAGLINDTVVGLPLGISSLSYILIYRRLNIGIPISIDMEFIVIVFVTAVYLLFRLRRRRPRGPPPPPPFDST